MFLGCSTYLQLSFVEQHLLPPIPSNLGSQGSSSHATSPTFKEETSQVLQPTPALSSHYNLSNYISLHNPTINEAQIDLIYTFSY